MHCCLWVPYSFSNLPIDSSAIYLFGCRPHNHGYGLALHLGLVFHSQFAGTGKRFNNLLKYLHADLRPYYLAAPEEHDDLCLVAFIDKTANIPYLELKIMLGYLRTNLDLFDIHGLPGRMLLAHLVLVLAEVHDPAYGRCRTGCHLYEIETSFARHLQRILYADNSQLTAFFIDEPDLSRPDALVDPDILAYADTSVFK